MEENKGKRKKKKKGSTGKFGKEFCYTLGYPFFIFLKKKVALGRASLLYHWVEHGLHGIRTRGWAQILIYFVVTIIINLYICILVSSYVCVHIAMLGSLL